MPKYGRRKFEFPEISQNRDCGGFTVPPGSLAYQDTLFLKSDEK